MKKRFSYANVIATLALFLALGGGAYAATQLPKNSIGAKQLKNGSITLAKLSGSTRAALAGAIGPQGPAGAPGAPGATHVTVRVGPFEEGRSVASCRSGEVATGGGGFVEPEEEEAWIWDTTPVQNNGEIPTAWEADATNVKDLQAFVQAYVICAAP